MKKVISLLLVTVMMLAMFTVSFSASFSVSDLDEDGKTIIPDAAEAIAAWEADPENGKIEAGFQRIYLQMPNGERGLPAEDDVITHVPEIVDAETGEVVSPEHDEVTIKKGQKALSWYNDFNIVDGKHYAGVYWWGGSADPEHNSNGWVGYRAEIEDYDQGIYYVDLPKDVVSFIWNNGVNGGTDPNEPIYYEAAQIGSGTNAQGAYPEDEMGNLPYGSPDPDCFDGCIMIVDPNQTDVNPLTSKQTCEANWYVYYGNGCYGQEFAEGKGDETEYPDGTDNWSEDMQDVCMNPDHFDASGKHVGYQSGPVVHTHTPGEAVKENEVAATYKAGGSYDSVVYCTECGEEISRETITTDPIALDPNKLYFDTNGTGWTMGAKDKVGFHIFGGDLGTEQNPTAGQEWGAKKAQGTACANMPGVFEFDPAAKLGLSFTPGVQYKIIFTHSVSNSWKEQTYDLLFTADCFGHVAYCDGTEYENPVDSSKKTTAAFWYGMDASQYGPVLQISSIGNVVGTCPEAGRTPESIFNDFLTVVDSVTGVTTYQNAYHYVVEPGTKTDQKMIDDIGEGLGLTKQQVYDAFTNNAVETTWDYTVSTLPGNVVIPTEAPTEAPTQAPTEAPTQAPTEAPTQAPTEAPTTPVHVHTPAAPVQENVKPATCTAEGSYDEVVYCSGCGEEISRETKAIGKLAHSLTFVPEVPATEEADGVAAHYVCGNCHKLFSDATGTTEVTEAELVIKKLDHVHTMKRVNKKNATETTDGYKSHFTCTTCGRYFWDFAGTNETTWDQIVIPKLNPTPTGLLGDANIDGEVDIIDVTVIQRIDINLITPTAAQKILGDVDKNNTVDITDATILQRWLVGLNQMYDINKEV